MIPFLHIRTHRSGFLIPFGTWFSTWVIYILKNAAFKNFINSIFLQKDSVFPLCSVNKKLPQVFALFVVFYAQATYSNTDYHLSIDDILTVNDNAVLFISKDAFFSTGKDAVVYSKIQHNNETNVNSGAFDVFIARDTFIYDDQSLLFVSKQNILQQAVPEKASVMPRDIDFQIAKLKMLPQTFHSLNSTVHLFYSMCCVFFFSVNSFSFNQNQVPIHSNVEVLCIPSTVQVAGTEHIFIEGNLIEKLGAPNVFVLKGSTFFVKNDLYEHNSMIVTVFENKVQFQKSQEKKRMDLHLRNLGIQDVSKTKEPQKQLAHFETAPAPWSTPFSFFQNRIADFCVLTYRDHYFKIKTILPPRADFIKEIAFVAKNKRSSTNPKIILHFLASIYEINARPPPFLM